MSEGVCQCSPETQTVVRNASKIIGSGWTECDRNESRTKWSGMEPSEYCTMACEKVCASLVLRNCGQGSVPCLAANGRATNVV